MDTELRRCNVCGEQKPLTAEYFGPRGKYFTRACRKCLNKKSSEWYQANKEYVAARNRVLDDKVREERAAKKQAHLDRLEWIRLHVPW